MKDYIKKFIDNLIKLVQCMFHDKLINMELIVPTKKENHHTFMSLALGTKFTYIGSEKEWVKIGAYNIAEWDDDNKTSGWIGQQICSFDEHDKIDRLVNVL